MIFARLLLSLALVFSSLPAYAVKEGLGDLVMPAAKMLTDSLGLTSVADIQGESYLKSCEGLLQAIQEEKVDGFLMGQIENENQALQLLQDYGLVFNQAFLGAIRMALNTTGKSDGVLANPSERRGYLKKIRAILNKPDRQKAFVDQVLAGMLKLTAAWPDPNVARVANLRMTKFIEALRTSENRGVIELAMTRAIRIVLLNTQKKLILHTTPMSKDAYLTPFMAVGALTGGVAAYFLTHWALTDLHYMDTMSIAFTYGANLVIGGALFLAVGGLLGESTFPFYANRRDAVADRIEAFKTVRFAGDPKSVKVVDLLGNYEAYLNSGVQSLEEACKTDVCNFSPAQIAYLGHIDILRLQDLGAQLGGVFSGSVIESAIGDAQTAARALMQNPSSIENQLVFMASINELESSLVSTPKSSGDALLAKINSVRAGIEKVKEIPYREQKKRMNRERLLKSEMLIVKLESDLASLQAMQFDQESFAAVLGRLGTLIGEINARAENLPANPGEWKLLAEDTLLNLEQLKLGAAR